MSESTGESTGGNGKGPDGTLPEEGRGIGLTADDEPTGFEPEEDPGAVEGPADDAGPGRS